MTGIYDELTCARRGGGVVTWGGWGGGGILRTCQMIVVQYFDGAMESEWRRSDNNVHVTRTLHTQPDLMET